MTVFAPAAPVRDQAADESTLDASVSRLWEAITGHRTADCPICDGVMRPYYGAGALPAGGRCTRCGSVLT